MTKGSLDDQKRLVSIKGARVAPSSTKGDPVTLSGKARNAAEKDLLNKLVNDVKGVKSVKNQMTIEESK
jgi:osmotically-inducible protein OsmY